MTTLAFIPARSKSTRWPGAGCKNIAPFLGEPLVVRAARLAFEGKALGLFDEALISLDGWNQVGQTLERFDISCWAQRPESVRRQDARVIDVLRAHLETMEDRPDLICVLLPTSPLRTLRHLVESFRLLEPGVDVVLSVTPFRQDVRGAVVEIKGPLVRVGGDHLPGGQILKHDGQCAWLRTENVLKGQGFYDGYVRPYLIPPEESADVDTELDLFIAESLAKRLGRQ